MVGFPGETRETMNKTLQLAKAVKPDSAQFYPVMPYPGTGAYIYYKQQGFLAHEDFEKWLDDKGGHQCVINLPGLSASELEDFCEQAFRKFHFGPAYLLYKLKQAVLSPREGLRSLTAGLKFIGYLLTRRKAQNAVHAHPQSDVPPNWHEHIRVPMGRMEHLRKDADRTSDPHQKFM